MKTKIHPSILVILILLLVGAGVYQFTVIRGLRFNAEENATMYKDATRDAKIYRDKFNRSVAEVKSIKTQNIKDFTEAIFTDSAMIRLQELVQENQKLLKKGGTANNFSSGTTIDKGTVNNTYVTSTGDTARESLYSDDWINYSILSLPDSTYLSLKTRDEYSVVNGYEKDPDKKGLKRLFARRDVPYSIVKSSSPYSAITEMKTYSTEMTKPSRFGFDAQIGITWTGTKFGPYAGAGIGYRIIEFNSKRTAR